MTISKKNQRFVLLFFIVFQSISAVMAENTGDLSNLFISPAEDDSSDIYGENNNSIAGHEDDDIVEPRSLDNLFETDSPGIVEKKPEALNLSEQITETYFLKWGGNISAKGLFSAGLLTWKSEELVASAGGEVRLGLNLRSKPWEHFSLFASSSIVANESTSSLSLDIAQLYIDYTFAEFLAFRIGRQSLAWGSSRIFPSPANITGNVGGRTSFKVFVPFLTNGLTFLVYPYSDEELDFGLGIKNAYLGFQLNQAFGPFRFELASRYVYEEPLISAVSVRASFGDFELGIDGKIDLNVDTSRITMDDAALLANLYWSPSDTGFELFSEYLGTNLLSENPDHVLGIAARYTLPSTTQFLAYWDRNLVLDAGRFVLGLKAPLGDGLKLDFGIPFIFGDYSSVPKSSLVSLTDPEKKAVGVAVQLSVSASF